MQKSVDTTRIVGIVAKLDPETSYTSYNTDGNPNGSASTPTSFSAATQKGGGASKNEGAASTREKKMMFSIRNFLIVLALSVHSIFEGMAVGNDNEESFLIWTFYFSM